MVGNPQQVLKTPFTPCADPALRDKIVLALKRQTTITATARALGWGRDVLVRRIDALGLVAGNYLIRREKGDHYLGELIGRGSAREIAAAPPPVLKSKMPSDENVAYWDRWWDNWSWDDEVAFQRIKDGNPRGDY